MASLSASEKEEIAKELETVATWVHGPRQAKVKALAARIRGEEPETPELAHDGDTPE